VESSAELVRKSVLGLLKSEVEGALKRTDLLQSEDSMLRVQEYFNCHALLSQQDHLHETCQLGSSVLIAASGQQRQELLHLSGFCSLYLSVLSRLIMQTFRSRTGEELGSSTKACILFYQNNDLGKFYEFYSEYLNSSLRLQQMRKDPQKLQ